jgi:hypothetical protein
LKKQKNVSALTGISSFDIVAIAASAGRLNAIKELVLQAINHRGKTIQCHVSCTPLSGGNKARQGMVLLVEEESDEK